MIPLQKQYGHFVRILHWCTDQTITNALTDMELTAAQGHILGFIAHRQQPPCPRDIEEFLHLSHPTVSGLLSRLEKKGFIEFRTDETDRRCKRIHILSKGIECIALIHQTILRNEAQMVQGFSEEEKALFSQLLQRAISNMGPQPCSRKHNHPKEEETQ